MKGLRLGAMAFVLAIGAGAGFAAAADEDRALTISDGMKVTMNYTMMLPDRTVADSTAGQEPFSYVQGTEEIIPGLEKALAGLKAGDQKRVTVPAAEAYGPYDETKKVNVPKSNVPSDVQVGMNLLAANGMVAKVLAINGDSVLMDVNHPLAGKDITFDVNILNVERPAR